MKPFAAVVLVTMLGCGLQDGSTTCTASACPNAGGLRVTLTSPPAQAYRVDATSGTTVRSNDCPSGGGCLVFFNNFMPAQATIRVVAAAGTATYDVRPQYFTSFPNGPDCGSCTGGVTVVSGAIGAVSVYKSAGSVQCAGGGLTPAQTEIELTSAGVGVISASCGVDANPVVAMCGTPDNRINIFEVQSADVAAAQALGFALLGALPKAVRTC